MKNLRHSIRAALKLCFLTGLLAAVLFAARNAEAHRGHTVDNMMLEAGGGNWSAVRHFIQHHNGGVDSVDEVGFTLFHYAAKDGEKEFMEFLESRGAKIPSELTCLMNPPAPETEIVVRTVTVTTTIIRETAPSAPSAPLCKYANDGECDEPEPCAPGTDGNDC